MTDENKNIENKQEENQNREECNKKWWKNVGFKPNLRTYIFILIILLFIFFLLTKSIKIINNNTNKNNLHSNVSNKKPISVKLNDDKNLFIRIDQLENKDLYISELKTESQNQLEYLRKKLLYANSADIELIRTAPMNISRYCSVLIKLDDGRIFIYDNSTCTHKYLTTPEIYDPESNSYKVIDSFNIDPGKLYHKFENGNLLFINRKSTFLFDINKDTIRKVAGGISHIKNYSSDSAYQLISYSDKIIFITHFYKNYIQNIEYNLDDYSYKIKEYKTDIEIAIDPIVINKRQLLIIDKNKHIYTYDVIKNEYMRRGSIKFFGKLYKVANNVVVIPNYNSEKSMIEPIQIINLDNFEVLTLKKVLSSNHCFSLENRLFCSPDLVLDLKTREIYRAKIPLKGDSYILDLYSRLGINNDEVITVGFMSMGSKDSTIVKIKKLNDDEYVRMEGLKKVLHEREGYIDLSDEVIQNIIDNNAI